ncbi:MAG TPA: sulfate ABC transporter substrate-binding protein [Intrasporangium sp.]|uniref:sulfate ABC transporter substrate-binding protein n=1 Tax=Intrasporangium sp. TaxID=1925024 RepID=UPI002D7A30F5|nr:sulfate ABC transporter substrate-binding protein [Intrasporangium sp.]HET7398712.1 sulfate ABC transporter substrate-binding protein [Intrasporangium sp.]
MPRPLLAASLVTTAAVTALGLSACAGGSSDAVAANGAQPSAASTTTLSLYAYAVPKVAFDKLIPAFAKTADGAGVSFQQSYGPSGDQSRKVEAGAAADLVNFSVEPDVTKLVDAGLIDATWNANEHKGIPFGSVVTIVVRKGNPKHITDWDDLLAPGVEVVTPNPFSSGSAKWNLLAPYAAKSAGGTNPAAGLAYVSKLVGEHVKIQPKSGREATEAFLQGSGDALLSYENEAIFAERNNDPVQHVTPPTTFKIENPAAVLKTSKNLEKAKAFNAFLYTTEAQTLIAEAGFRPVDATVATKFATSFPEPAKLWTIKDLGGWSTVNDKLFKKDVGAIAKIYEEATK